MNYFSVELMMKFDNFRANYPSLIHIVYIIWQIFCLSNVFRKPVIFTRISNIKRLTPQCSQLKMTKKYCDAKMLFNCLFLHLILH